MNVETVDTIGNMVLLTAVVAGVVFLVIYSTLARWWENREGWYLFSSSGIIAAILAYNYAVVAGWFDLTDPAVRAWARLLIYGGGLAIMLWRGALLILAQLDDFRVRREARRKDRIR